MSKVRSDNISNRADNGSPKLVYGAEVPVGYGITGAGGINITGIATAASFSGNLTGNVSGATGTFTGNVSVGGTLTYEDVTNIDSVGIITARSDISIADKIIHTGDTNTAIRFPAADTFTVETTGSERLRIDSSGRVLINSTTVQAHGNMDDLQVGDGSGNRGITISSGTSNFGSVAFGDSTDGAGTDRYSGFLEYYHADNSMRFGTVAAERLRITSGGTAIFKAGLAEKYENAGTTLGSQPNNPLSDGNVILFTGNESGNKTINFTGVHATLSNGETVSFTAILTPNNSGKITVAQVDGQAITIKWSGGSAPSAGASGQDIYTFQILKTGTGVSNYTIFGAAANYA